MKKLLISLAIASSSCAAYAAPAPSVQSPSLPQYKVAEGATPTSVIEKMLFAKTGKVVTLADGKWLIIYGSRAVTNTQLDELGLTAAASIDVLTRPNGTHDGTILISEK